MNIYLYSTNVAHGCKYIFVLNRKKVMKIRTFEIFQVRYFLPDSRYKCVKRKEQKRILMSYKNKTKRSCPPPQGSGNMFSKPVVFICFNKLRSSCFSFCLRFCENEISQLSQIFLNERN